MMDRLFETASVGADAIIRNEKALHLDSAPNVPLLRERELKEIAQAIKPLLENKHGENLFIHGPPGSGKLSSMNYVLAELMEETSRVVPVYVNCWEYPTQMGVYSKVIEELEMPIPRRGLAADEVFNRIRERMDDEGITILLVLDKVNSLIIRGEEGVFHSLSRANATDRMRFGVIGISADSDALSRLSDQVRSSIQFTTLEFKEYTLDQLRIILKERAEAAFAAGSCPEAVLEACAQLGAANKGNARFALEILWKAARNAEKRGSKKIGSMDVLEVSSRTYYEKTSLEESGLLFDLKNFGLSDEEKLALEIIAKRKEVLTTDLYRDFKAVRARSSRQIRNYVSLLGAKGLIRIANSGGGLLKGRKIQLLLRK